MAPEPAAAPLRTLDRTLGVLPLEGSVKPDEIGGAALHRGYTFLRTNMTTSEPPRAIAIPFGLWATGAAAASVLLFRALGQNQYEYYLHLRWVVTVVSAAGVCAAFSADKTGWAITFGVTTLLYNPLLPFSFDRSTWMLLNICTAAFMVAAVGFIGLPLRQQWVARSRELIDRVLLSLFFAAWSVVVLDVIFVLVVLAISYVARGNESLSDAWDKFRYEYRFIIYTVGLAITAVFYLVRLKPNNDVAPTATAT